MIIEDAKKYLDLYYIEHFLFNTVGPQIRKRGFIKFDEFYRICMWKSARQKQNYLRNKDSIETISKSIFSETDEIQKLKKLLELKGVGIPTASAILTIVFPDRYAVIDIRCMQMLNKLGLSINNTITESRWIQYLQIVRKLAVENDLTPRKIDQILYSMHTELLNGDDYRNLY